jgi:hypothetical protein
MTKIDATFEITGWDQQAYDEPDDGLPLSRATTVRKRFAGPLEGESVAELLMCGEAAYLANERVRGTLEGRTGTFVLQHGAVTDRGSFGYVVPGSGTGDLAGVRGEAVMEHGRIALEYEL